MNPPFSAFIFVLVLPKDAGAAKMVVVMVVLVRFLYFLAGEECREVLLDGEDMWASVAELATILRGFGTPDVPLTQSTAGSSPPSGDLVPLRLSEDTFLRGYEPLLSAHSSIFFAPSTALMGRAQDWARVSRLQTCLCQFLCGVDPPVLRLQKTEQGDMLVSVVDTSPPPSPAAVKSSFSGSDVEVEESLSESETSECGEEEQDLEGSMEEDGLSSTVKLLKKRKMMLEKKHRRQKRLHSLLEGSVTLEMEVRPRYLVPDTNCFIEHLDVVQDLAGGPYTVMVPLVGELRPWQFDGGELDAVYCDRSLVVLWEGTFVGCMKVCIVG
ncbi:Telomerase-binding protein EST1A [Portunus trituberculatus]|uniref:Telomerase-binding protein EST1A n=1 Tax=Portunus trituberculatus TaxID=210409 RepID=A0A5B7EJU5_PORTR|nr:Telomerase-binding protein EST1A [Portunus trituberculatus]